MKIKNVLRPFVDELVSFLDNYGDKEQEATENIIDGEIYIMIEDEYFNVDMINSYWYHEDDGTIVFRVNDIGSSEVLDCNNCEKLYDCDNNYSKEQLIKCINKRYDE